LEQYLHIYGNFQQDDWASWLPIAQFVHNSWPSETTKQTPFELLIGHTPTIGPMKTGGKIPDFDRCKEHLLEKRNQARTAIQKAQAFLQKRNVRKRGQRAYEPYQEGDRVWLDGTNITISHPFAKLEPKHYDRSP
jgi:hypothetical protein